MQQHPIPQNVTQYQFRLVGNMTLKQFLELAGGLIFAYLTYLSNLIFIIKIPLSTLFALLGIGAAFFPIEERPLDQWIINFFRAIYSPTIYHWKKDPTIPAVFQFQPQLPTNNKSTPKQPPTNPKHILRLKNQLIDPEPDSKLLNYINRLFNQFPQTPPPNSTRHHQQITPNKKPSIRVRKLHKQPPNTPTFHKPIPAPQSPTFTTNPTIQPVVLQPTPKIIFQTPSPSTETINQSTQPETINIAPLTPKKPNLIAGLVTDQHSKILDGIIVEIVDSKGVPQRAVKTNALGQFSISTPLPPGEYFVKVDDNQLNIPAQKITINNQIIPPIHLHPKPITNPIDSSDRDPLRDN